MAGHSFWKGYLKLSLVTCPVAMTPATSEAEKIRFHTLNRATGNRVEGIYVDAESGERVDDDDQARGYEREPGSYVVIEDDELDAVALESTRTIDVETFVRADSIEWLWYDKPHFLMPDDPVGEEAFAVIREAMAVTGTVGLSRLVMYRRERPVMLEPRERGIVLWTLHYADELRAPEGYFEDIDGKADPDLVGLVSRLIDRRTRDWDRTLVHDPLQENLRALIEDKKKRRRPTKARRGRGGGDPHRRGAGFPPEDAQARHLLAPYRRLSGLSRRLGYAADPRGSGAARLPPSPFPLDRCGGTEAKSRWNCP